MANSQPYYGNNGQGTSEEMNKDVQLRKTDPNYVNSQIEHANNVIKTRQSEGLDITAQLNYLNKLKQDAQAFQPKDNQGNSNTFSYENTLFFSGSISNALSCRQFDGPGCAGDFANLVREIDGRA